MEINRADASCSLTTDSTR